MKTFLEKTEIYRMPCYIYGYDFSVSAGDDDYDFSNFINRSPVEIVSELYFSCKDETGITPKLITRYPSMKDYGDGNGYVKIYVLLEKE